MLHATLTYTGLTSPGELISSWASVRRMGICRRGGKEEGVSMLGGEHEGGACLARLTFSCHRYCDDMATAAAFGATLSMRAQQIRGAQSQTAGRQLSSKRPACQEGQQ